MALAATFIKPTDGMVIRTMFAWESLPATLRTGFENLPIDRNWIWVASVNGAIKGAIVAAPAHGMVVMLRIAVDPKASLANRSLLRNLLKNFLADVSSRGYKGYLVCLDTDRKEEQALSRIVKRAGGRQFGKGGVFAGMTNYRIDVMSIPDGVVS